MADHLTIHKTGYGRGEYRLSSTSRLDLEERLHERLRTIRAAPMIKAVGMTLSEDEIIGILISLTYIDRLP